MALTMASAVSKAWLWVKISLASWIAPMAATTAAMCAAGRSGQPEAKGETNQRVGGEMRNPVHGAGEGKARAARTVMVAREWKQQLRGRRNQRIRYTYPQASL